MRRLFLLLGLISLLLVVPVASMGSLRTAGADPIVIGAATAQSGFFSAFDGPALKMAELKIADINRRGGIAGRQIKLVKADSKSDPNQSATAALEVIEKGATIVLVSCDFDFGAPGARVAEGKGLISFSLCAASPKFGVQGVGPHAYSMGFATPAMASLLAEFAYTVKHFKTAYFLKDESLDFTRSFCDSYKQRWTQLGGKVAGQDVFKNSDPSIASQITRLKATKNVASVIVCSYVPGGATALRQIRAAGVTTPIIGPDGFDGSYWLKSVPKLSNFYYAAAVSLAGDDPDPRVRMWLSRYRQATGKPCDLGVCISGVSVIEALQIAIQRAHSTEPNAIKKALDGFRNVNLVVGPTTYTSKLHITTSRAMRIMQIQNGKPHFVRLKKATKVNGV